MAKKASSKVQSVEEIVDLTKVSQKTGRKELFWVKGKKTELPVYRIPTKHLYFNIQNGRYADKMIQLREDNLNVEIDPRQEEWKQQILRMLMGEYQGTQGDQAPFENLKKDILAREQLSPGVVLHDGGVLDGNRRLAVLLNLKDTAPRFEYFEGVILPEDVDEVDRWRIEAGLQLGRNEKHPYSAVNELLKIREGLELFRKSHNPEQEIAKTLYGIPEKEIKKDIQKINLIDEYLAFIGKPNAYNEISAHRLNERFEEAVITLDRAKDWPRDRFSKLKLSLFAVIRDEAMQNWDMRDIRKAMGGKGKAAKYKNDKALDDFISIGSNVKELQKALASNGTHSPLREVHKEKTEQFLDRMEVIEKMEAPSLLAERAKTSLEALLQSIEEGGIARHAEWKDKVPSLSGLLEEIVSLGDKCSKAVKKLQRKPASRS